MSKLNKLSDSACTQDHQHPDHKADLHRLKRINGQVEGIGRMIIENRYCPDILIQTRAVMSAIRSLEASLLERHLNHCVKSAFESEDESESIPSSRAEILSRESNLDVGILGDEFDESFEAVKKITGHAQQNLHYGVLFVCLLDLSLVVLEDDSDELHQGNQERPKGDRSEMVPENPVHSS